MHRSALQSDVDLTSFNTFGVAARARYFARINDAEELRAVLLSRDVAQRLLILGGGSNLLLTQDFPGLVLHINLLGKRIVARESDATLVEVAAGENWHEFVCWTLQQHLAGLENLSLIPGAAGAAPIQNIGAYGVEMKDLFYSLRAMDIDDGRMRTFDRAACNFAYRDSVFKRELKDRYVILSVTFRLPDAAKLHLDYGELGAELTRMGKSAPTAQDVSDAVCNIRRRKLPDPAVIGNAGSFFKNPIVDGEILSRLQASHDNVPHFPVPDGKIKLAAGWLIEQCGWKGKSLGRAGVHEKHALVLVNRGGASGQEILELARAIQASVREKFAIDLEPEPVIV